MLIKFCSSSPYSTPRLRRLLVLEYHVRRQSSGDVTMRQYQDWLEDEKVVLPSRRTLLDDFNLYAAACDDVRHEPYERGFSLKSDAKHDAICHVLGHPWLNAPLQPNLSSAALRCLLLAQDQGWQVRFDYRPLRPSGEPWLIHSYQGYPVQLLAGRDSGYIQMNLRDESEGRMVLRNFNLARIAAATVRVTDDANPAWPLPDDPRVTLVLRTRDPGLRQRLSMSFNGFSVEGDTLRITVPRSQATMLGDLLHDHVERTVRPRGLNGWCTEQADLEVTIDAMEQVG